MLSLWSERRRYARRAIHDAFGELCELLFALLVDYGRMSLAEIMHRLSPPFHFVHVRNALLTLLQHHVVLPLARSSSSSSSSSMRNETLVSGDAQVVRYEAQLEMAVYRSRYPRYVNHVLVHCGPLASFLFREILEHGRIQRELCIEKTLDRIQVGYYGTEETPDKDDLQAAFVELARLRLIKSAPLVEFSVEDESEGENSQSSLSKGGDLASSSKDKNSKSVLLQFHAAGAGDSGSISSVSASSSRGARGSSSTSKSAGRGKVGKSARISASKRTLSETHLGSNHDESTMASLHSSSDFISEPVSKRSDQRYWMIHVDEFHRVFRYECIQDFVEKKCIPHVSLAMRSLLQCSARTDTDPKRIASAPITLEEIQAIIQAENAQTIDRPSLLFALDMMCRSPMNLLNRFGGMTPSYQIRFEDIIDQIRMQYIESIICGRYGDVGGRILRMLHEKKQMEPKQIALAAMRPTSEVREKIHLMMRDDIVSVQVIPKSIDRKTTRSIHTFHLNTVGIDEQFRSLMYRAMLNLLARHSGESDSLLEKIASSAQSGAFTHEQEERFLAFSHVENALLTHFYLVDDLVCLFEDL